MADVTRRSILIVDDDAAVRDALSSVLSDEGYAVQAVRDGDEALRALRSGARMPDLVLLDLMMPGTNGWSFRDQQRKDPELSHIPVVVMSAMQNLRGAPIRAFEFLSKPVQLDHLLATVRRFCGEPVVR